MKHILETERLKLRQLKMTDAAFIIELVNTPSWLEFIGDRNIHSEDDAIRYLKDGPIKSYNENGFGLWLVLLKNNKTSIGMCGILKRDTLENPDIGFAFLPEFMGTGYAFEIADAVMIYAKNELKLKTVLAITVPSNKRSIHLLNKTGFKFSKMIPSSDDHAELMLYQN